MEDMKVIRMFIASSILELKEDRDLVGYFIYRLNRILNRYGIDVDLFECEDSDAAYNGVRKQDEYNAVIRESDIFVALFYMSHGKFTEEEIKKAEQAFLDKGFPKIFVYFKDFDPQNVTLTEFRRSVSRIRGACVADYRTDDCLKVLLLRQLYDSCNLQQVLPLCLQQGYLMVGDLRVAMLDNLPQNLRSDILNML